MYSDFGWPRPGFVFIDCGTAPDGRVISIPLRERFPGSGLPSISSAELTRVCVAAWARFWEALHWLDFEARTEALVIQQRANQILLTAFGIEEEEFEEVD